MKSNDIHICAFPKSGITYFGFLLAAARLRHNGMALVPHDVQHRLPAHRCSHRWRTRCPGKHLARRGG